MKRLDLGLEPDKKEFRAMLQALVNAHGITRAAESLGVPDRTLRHWRHKGGGVSPAHRRLVWFVYLFVMHPGALRTLSDLLVWCRDKRAGWPTLPPQETGAANLQPHGEPTLPPVIASAAAPTCQKFVAECGETLNRIKSAMEVAETVLAAAKGEQQKFKALNLIAVLANSYSKISMAFNNALRTNDKKQDHGLPETPSFYLQFNKHTSPSETPAKNGNETKV
jgi:hypothetical protein